MSLTWLEKHRQFVHIVAITLLLFYACELYLHASRTSVTIDEQVHILAGYRYWECGDFSINPEHPPLLKLIAAWPLHFRRLWTPPPACGSAVTSKLKSFTDGPIFLIQNGIDKTVMPARMAAATCSLALACVVYLAGIEFFGLAAGLIALLLTVVEPNLIAHGSLVTTDMAVTAAFLASVYTLFRWNKANTWPRFVCLALALGALLCAKHSGSILALILIFLALVDVFFFLRKEPAGAVRTRRWARTLLGLGAALILGILCLWPTYAFRYSALPGNAPPELSGYRMFSESNAPKLIKTVVVDTCWVLEKYHLIPQAYIYGFADVMRQKTRGLFFLGKFYDHALRLYFPVTFALKTSLSLLVLLILGLSTLPLYRLFSREMFFLLFSLGFYFAMAVSSRMNIGVRHILPIYPFCILIAAAGQAHWARSSRFKTIAASLILLFAVCDSLRAFPNYIAFSNELDGGTSRTYRFLNDSNVDWGQSLKEVAQFIEKNHVGECWIAAQGNPEIARVMLPCHVLPAPFDPRATLPEAIPEVIRGAVFLSSAAKDPDLFAVYKPISATPPRTMIGGAVLVYNGEFDVPLAAAMSHVNRAEFYEIAGDPLRAVEESEIAVSLGSDDVRTHHALAEAFAAANKKPEAKQELVTTLALCAVNRRPFFRDCYEANLLLRALDGSAGIRK
jgi:hypothetical protein